MTDGAGEGAREPAGESATARRPGGLVRKIVLATLLGALVFAALALYGDVAALRTNLRAFRFEMLALSIVLASGNYLIRYGRFQFYLRQLGYRVPHGDAVLVFLSGFVMSVTPGKVGEVWKSVLLYESHGLPIVRTAPIVVAERVTDLLALVLLTALGALSFEQGGTIALIGAAFVGVALFVSAHRPSAELALLVLGRLPWVGRMVPKLRDAYDALHQLSRPGPVILCTALATAAWALEVLALEVVLLGFRPEVSMGLEAVSFVYSASTIAGALAMMPGGLGVTEAGMTGLLDVLGGDAVTPAIATAATMLVRLATLWWAVGVGLGAFAVYRARLRRRPTTKA